MPFINNVLRRQCVRFYFDLFVLDSPNRRSKKQKSAVDFNGVFDFVHYCIILREQKLPASCFYYFVTSNINMLVCTTRCMRRTNFSSLKASSTCVNISLIRIFTISLIRSRASFFLCGLLQKADAGSRIAYTTMPNSHTFAQALMYGKQTHNIIPAVAAHAVAAAELK